jgi:hypothetical protein
MRERAENKKPAAEMQRAKLQISEKKEMHTIKTRVLAKVQEHARYR